MISGTFSTRLRFHIATLLALFALSGSPLYAGTLHVAETGTFDSATPLSTFTGPGGDFSFSFDVDALPNITNSATGYFALPFTNFNYALNGTSIPLTPSEIDLFANSYGGLFDVCLDASCTLGDIFKNGLIFSGPQMYSGSESSPSIFAGSFTPTFAGVVVDGSGYLLNSQSDISTEVEPASVTPEPSSLFLLGTGMLAMSVKLSKRRT